METIQPLLDLIPSEWRNALAWLLPIMGALRLCLKPASALLKAGITRAIETASNSIDPEDDTWIESIVASRPYRVLSYLLDLLASVKLPSSAELHQPRNSTTAP